MKTRTIIAFIAAFIISFLGFQGLSHFLNQNQAQLEFKQNHIILEDIRFRFKLFLDIQTSIGTFGSEYLSSGNIKTLDYGPLNSRLLQINKQIIGFNILDEEGKIIRVYPEEKNQRALGQMTQNLNELKRSLDKGEPFWFSPPFNLYQGDQGFILYFPIVEDKNLKGWFATVITTQLFRKDFDLREFLKTYNLVILDNTTGRHYYATGVEPDEKVRSYKSQSIFHGREISFISWRKDPAQIIIFPVSWIIFGSLFLALLSTIIYAFYQQKKRARVQLQDIRMLLNLTSKEAISKLIDLQQEIYKIGNPENAKYITNLIEQIDLLQSTANSKTELEKSEVNILPLLMEEINDVDYLIKKKNMQLKFHPDNFVNIKIATNPWLFKNSVLGAITTYAIIYSDYGSGLAIECHESSSNHIITFHSERTYELDMDNQYINLDRRIEVARKVLALSSGTLKLDQDMGGGLIIRIEFPILRRNGR